MQEGGKHTAATLMVLNPSHVPRALLQGSSTSWASTVTWNQHVTVLAQGWGHKGHGGDHRVFLAPQEAAGASMFPLQLSC